MPNKTIYVADGDLPLFQRAQELAGGNLSSAIGQALHRYVQDQEDQMNGITEVKVRVGDTNGRHLKRFRGAEIATWRHSLGAGSQAELFTVYQTVKGALAVHREVRQDWRKWSDPEAWSKLDKIDWSAEWNDWKAEFSGGGQATLDVYASIEEMRPHVPAELADLVERNLTTPEVEDLDI